MAIALTFTEDDGGGVGDGNTLLVSVVESVLEALLLVRVPVEVCVVLDVVEVV